MRRILSSAVAISTLALSGGCVEDEELAKASSPVWNGNDAITDTDAAAAYVPVHRSEGINVGTCS